MSPQSNHFDSEGNARMVDVTAKHVTVRKATASVKIVMQPETMTQIQRGQVSKGDVLAVARLAGIQATKHTATLIPLCHPIPVESVDVEFLFLDDCTLECRVSTGTTAKTGVEMEALTACSTSALTVYDMCKSIDRGMQITDLCLLAKSGGKSGDFIRQF